MSFLQPRESEDSGKREEQRHEGPQSSSGEIVSRFEELILRIEQR